jgi:hydroxymethylglutaryl-CoA synthase
MAGITSMGVYIPMYRLKHDEIARMWGVHAIGGEKAVAGYDEDPVTMAVAAARECLKSDALLPKGLFFASTTAPYQEKLSAAIISNSVGLDQKSFTADFANSLKSGTTALKSALDAINAGSAERVLVVAADCRLGLPKGRFEQLFGDAAAALAIGNEGVIAQIESFSSLTSEFIGLWRTNADRFVKSGESRFIDTQGYFPLMQKIISDLMESHNIKPGDFSKIILPAFDARQHTALASKLGFEAFQVQDPLFARIGHTGTAATLIMLIAALEQARPEDRILLANYGDGADAMVIRVTEEVTKVQTGKRLADRLENNRCIDYGTYLSWRDLIQLEKPSLPPRGEPSLSARWRERHVISTLSGVKCRQCGLPQIHTIGQNIRICVGCQSKDDFDPYSFSDKKGSLFTYAVDRLQPTKNPPGLNGVVDFEGGGRLICELTDYDLDRVEIGMPIEMTFRKMFQGEGIINYFWKAKPAV